MLDMERILTIGFEKVNGLKPGELAGLPKDKSTVALRKELRWALRSMSGASESRIKAIIGSGSRYEDYEPPA